MLKRAFQSVLSFLDLLWPFPLGIAFGVLVVGASAGAWLVFRESPTPHQAPQRTSPVPAAKSPAPAEIVPPPLEPAPPTPTQTAVPAAPQPVEATTSSPANATPESVRPSATRPLTAQEVKVRDTLTRARWYMRQGQYGPATEEFQAALAMDPSNREVQAGLQQARAASGSPAPSPQPARAAPSRPPVTPDAKLRDTLTRARWYMKQGQYRPAIEEFQAVLAVDPSNREAQTGLEQARQAGGIREPSPQQ
ncbi:MAG: hypothetical protein ACE145_09985 [Terriglobia bacterium]